MIETLINIATIINAIAIVVLVIVTWMYTKATKRMADTMYKQFVYESKPYLSIEYHQKESMGALVLEFKNNSKKSRINVHYDLFLVPPEKAVKLELKNPENIEKLKMLWPSEDIIIEPGETYPLNPSIIIQEGLIEIGVDTEKNYIYGIVIKGHYTPDIPDIGPFPILKYWQVMRSTKVDAWSVIPNNFF